MASKPYKKCSTVTMKLIFILSLFTSISYSNSQYSQTIKRNQKSLCETSNKNSLIEHFFNIIFTDFYATPPVCVCVQMCAGQSTYCYPNGCLKAAITTREDVQEVKKAAEIPPPQIQKNKNHFMLLNNDKYDFMTDFLEKNYVDASNIAAASHSAKLNTPIKQDLRPDPFKDKYSIVGKYKRIPNIEIRYNLKEKVRSSKFDALKYDGVNLSKPKWPMSKQNIGQIRKFDKLEKPIFKSSFFTAMLPETDVAEYPPKYFKRDLTKTADNDEANTKTYYALEDPENTTDLKSFSLEMLIENLIKSNHGEKIDTTTLAIVQTENQTTTATEKALNTTNFTNETMSVISINFTNENIDKNKYGEDNSKENKTIILNEIIMYLSKEIEKQNNTSMEMAKRVIDDFDEKAFKSNSEDNASTDSLPSTETVEYLDKSLNMTTTDVPTTAATVQEDNQVTKKNRQRIIRKLTSSKVN